MWRLLAFAASGELLRDSPEAGHDAVGSSLRASFGTLFQGSVSGQDCTFRMPRTPLPSPLSRIVPAPDAEGIALAWQDGERILLRRLRRDCHDAESDVAETQEVTSSRDFWRRPDGSGLADAVGLHQSPSTAVAWLMGGDVWVRVMTPGSTPSEAVRANNASTQFRDRAQVKLAASPGSDGGFVAIWSSWAQDGDGWGVFARPFDVAGRPIGPERQVNTAWRHFQSQPQVLWCGSSLWALWANGTGVPCTGPRPPSGCATGPFLKHLHSIEGNATSAGDWRPQEEVTLGGARPLAPTLSCGDGEEATTLWLEQGGRQVSWKFTRPNGSAQETREPASGGALNLETFANPSINRSILEEVLGRQLRSSKALEAVDQGDGQVTMLASGSLLVVLTKDSRGSLSAQLLDFRAKDGAIAFPERKLSYGASLVRAAWDTGERGRPPALVSCFITGGGVDSQDDSNFVCLRRRAQWLASEDGLGIGDSLVLVLMLAVVMLFCCLRQCAQSGRGGMRRPLIPQRENGDRSRARAGLRTDMAQIRALQAQLAQIPETPAETARQTQMTTQSPSSSPTADGDAAAAGGAEPLSGNAGGADDGAEGPAVAARGNAVADTCSQDIMVCAICQEGIVVRVALQPCGHTACRDCVTRLVEINRRPRCHICRASIAGVQPVYI